MAEKIVAQHFVFLKDLALNFAIISGQKGAFGISRNPCLCLVLLSLVEQATFVIHSS